MGISVGIKYWTVVYPVYGICVALFAISALVVPSIVCDYYPPPHPDPLLDTKYGFEEAIAGTVLAWLWPIFFEFALTCEDTCLFWFLAISLQIVVLGLWSFYYTWIPGSTDVGGDPAQSFVELWRCPDDASGRFGYHAALVVVVAYPVYWALCLVWSLFVAVAWKLDPHY